MPRYLNRFAMYLGEPMIELTTLIDTKYNEYDVVIVPWRCIWKRRGVRLRKGRACAHRDGDKGKETCDGLVYDDDSGASASADAG